MLVAIVSSLLRQPLDLPNAALLENTTQAVGEAVLTRFVLPFELLALLMLAAMLGAIYFARPEE
jgi:NADH-quinone oxidoreductase subunit J